MYILYSSNIDRSVLYIPTNIFSLNTLTNSSVIFTSELWVITFIPSGNLLRSLLINSSIKSPFMNNMSFF